MLSEVITLFRFRRGCSGICRILRLRKFRFFPDFGRFVRIPHVNGCLVILENQRPDQQQGHKTDDQGDKNFFHISPPRKIGSSETASLFETGNSTPRRDFPQTPLPPDTWNIVMLHMIYGFLVPGFARLCNICALNRQGSLPFAGSSGIHNNNHQDNHDNRTPDAVLRSLISEKGKP